MRAFTTESGLGVDPLEAIVGRAADRIFNALLPKMKEIVAQASQAAEPTIRTVIREEVLPKFGLAAVLGLAAMGAISAAIGSWFATRRNPPVRRRWAA